MQGDTGRYGGGARRGGGAPQLPQPQPPPPPGEGAVGAVGAVGSEARCGCLVRLTNVNTRGGSEAGKFKAR